MRIVVVFFLNLTAAIYYYITTKFGYTKGDLHLAAYDSVVLQQVLVTLSGQSGKPKSDNSLKRLQIELKEEGR